MTKLKILTHACDPQADKYCAEGADPARHDASLPADHPGQHGSHKDGCVCVKGRWLNLNGMEKWIEVVHIA